MTREPDGYPRDRRGWRGVTRDARIQAVEPEFLNAVAVGIAVDSFDKLAVLVGGHRQRAQLVWVQVDRILRLRRVHTRADDLGHTAHVQHVNRCRRSFDAFFVDATDVSRGRATRGARALARAHAHRVVPVLCRGHIAADAADRAWQVERCVRNGAQLRVVGHVTGAVVGERQQRRLTLLPSVRIWPQRR